jgi:hypothetical protein
MLQSKLSATNTQELTNLRQQLPHRYAGLISKKLKLITDAQVRGVFGGLIKNPDIVEPVIKEAKNLANKVKKMKQQLKEYSK